LVFYVLFGTLLPVYQIEQNAIDCPFAFQTSNHDLVYIYIHFLLKSSSPFFSFYCNTPLRTHWHASKAKAQRIHRDPILTLLSEQQHYATLRSYQYRLTPWHHVVHDPQTNNNLQTRRKGGNMFAPLATARSTPAVTWHATQSTLGRETTNAHFLAARHAAPVKTISKNSESRSCLISSPTSVRNFCCVQNCPFRGMARVVFVRLVS